jgi:hypothetical protein
LAYRQKLNAAVSALIDNGLREIAERIERGEYRAEIDKELDGHAPLVNTPTIWFRRVEGFLVANAAMVTGVLTSIALLSLGCFQVTPSSYANGAFAGFGLAVGLASVLLEYVKHTRNNLFDPNSTCDALLGKYQQ